VSPLPPIEAKEFDNIGIDHDIKEMFPWIDDDILAHYGRTVIEERKDFNEQGFLVPVKVKLPFYRWQRGGPTMFEAQLIRELKKLNENLSSRNNGAKGNDDI